MHIKFLIYSLFFLIFQQNTYAQNKKPLKNQEHLVNKALATFTKDKVLKNASIGFLAVDLKSNEVIAEFNPDLSLMPASTQKIITTAAALELLGTRHIFKTQIEYSGNIDTVNKVLNGNIYIKGGADPTLGSKYYDKKGEYKFISSWINSLKNNKIHKVNGHIIADASRYSTEITPPKFTWEDVGNYYGAGANGLTAFDNLYEIYFESPALPDKLTKITKVEPQIPNLEIQNEVLSSSVNKDEAFIFGAPYTYLHIIRGTIPKAKSEFTIKGAIPDPAYYLAWKFKNDLELAGVPAVKNATTIRLMELKGDTIKEKRHSLHITFSPSLTSIVNITNKRSINLYAEHLFNEIGLKLKKEGSNSAGREAIELFWKNKGMDTDGFHIYDGSGLSRFNSITAAQLVFILDYMKNKSKNYEAFYESLPVAGKSGTLRNIGKNTAAHGVVHAKSGSIGRVRAFAGYVTTKSGRELAFSINVANYNCSSYAIKKKMTDLMVAMANFNL